MKKAGLFILLVLFVLPVTARAQEGGGTQETPPAAPQAPAQTPAATTTPHPPPINYLSKYEVSGGFSYRKFYFPGETLGTEGWFGSAEYNWKSHLGVYLDASGDYRDRGLTGASSIYGLLIGPQFYPFGHHRMTVFTHLLAGVGYYRNVIPANGGFAREVQNDTATAWGVGAGLDFYVKRHLAVRMFEYDYDRANFFGQGSLQGSGRISVGVVYRFGNR